jgi:hypothetical protein
MQMQVGKGFFAEQLGRSVRMGEGMGGCVWQTEAPVLVADYSNWSGRLDDPALDGLALHRGHSVKIRQTGPGRHRYRPRGPQQTI